MYERFLKHRLFFRRILFFVDVLSIFLFFAGAVVTLWLYANPEYELYRVTEANASNSVEHKIVDDTALQSLQQSESSESEPTLEGVTYDAGAVREINSIDMLKEDDPNEKLYLRSYVSVPFAYVKKQIFEGLSEKVLSRGAGTVKPNQSLNKIGNYAVAAHNLRDFDVGNGFSHFQKYREQLIGQNIYVSDGRTVYTYRIVRADSVQRDKSMKYTEDDWANQMLQDEIKQYEILPEQHTTNKIYNEDGSYYEVDTPKTFTYGHLFTTYTCEAYYNRKTGHYESLNRVLVTGVLIDKCSIRTADAPVRELFPEAIKEASDAGVDTSVLETTAATALSHSDGAQESEPSLAESVQAEVSAPVTPVALKRDKKHDPVEELIYQGIDLNSDMPKLLSKVFLLSAVLLQVISFTVKFKRYS